jgi:hypothetical protein
VGAVTSERVLKVLFYVKILQCFFVVGNFTTNAVSVAIGDNGNRLIVQGRIHKLKNCVNSRPKSVFKDQEADKCLSSLHDKYVIVPADKAMIFNSIHNYLEIMFPIDVLRFFEFRTMRNHLSETLMLNDIQICYRSCGQGFQQYRICM